MSARPPNGAVAFALAGMLCAAGSVRAQRAVSPEAHARQEQLAFAQLRRHLLPVMPLGDHLCEYSIGRLCYWDDPSGPSIPAEDAGVTTARARLRTFLDSLGEVDPASDYIVGQRVRYDLEGHDDAAAGRAAAACAATPWWCEALRGLVRHRTASEAASAAAYDSAITAMPDTIRCAWLDADAWLPPYAQSHRRTDGHHCDAEMKTSARVFWLGAPLLTWRRNALRDEFLSRRTMQLLLADSVNRGLPSFDWDVGVLSLRYGWPDRWARGNTSRQDPPLIGQLPKPSFDFVPNPDVLGKPFDATPADFALPNDPAARMRYAPGFVRAIGTMAVQTARFRRGDTMIVVAVYDGRAMTDSVSSTVVAAGSLSAGLAPESTFAMSLTPGEATGVIVLRARARPALAAVELVDSTRAIAERWRAGIEPLPASSTISDLLIGVGGPTFNPFSPQTAGDYAVPVLTFTPHDTVALYWETYLEPPPGTPVRVSVRLTRLATGFFGRLSHAVGLSHGDAEPTIAWTEIRPDSSVARSIRLGIPDVPPGRYRIEVSMQNQGAAGTTSRDIRIDAAR